jgi:hypothetical protein
MFRASSAHHQDSLTVHTASSFCVCVRPWHCHVRNSFLQDSAADTVYMKMHGPGNIKFYIRFEFLSLMASWEDGIVGCDAVQSGSIVSDGPTAYIIEAHCLFFYVPESTAPHLVRRLPS